MTREKHGAQKTTDREIVSMRMLDFSRELIFRAWTDPACLEHWWGPKEFSISILQFDLRPGGSWRQVMQSPAGEEHYNESLFVEIEKPERLVFHHVSAPQYYVVATFEDLGGKTKLGWRMLFDSVDECEQEKYHARGANEQYLDRLEEQLARMVRTLRIDHGTSNHD